MWLRRILRTVLYLSALLGITGLFCSLIVSDNAAAFVYDDLENIPACNAAIVLGTARTLSDGRTNLFFDYRMEAAARLFHSGKVKVLILSGDNRVTDYNEPKIMRKSLLARGVPDSCMISDYAGLRTFDSMVRCREVFGQDRIIVVSQKFHNERAVYIGRKKGIAAFGYNAPDPASTASKIKISFREFFSRIKCVMDIYLLNTKPRHLGSPINIRLTERTDK